MKVRACVLFVVAAVLASACAHRTNTYPYIWQLRGGVVAVSDTMLEVRHKSGAIVDLQIDDETVFMKNKQRNSSRAVLRGTRVIVDVETIGRGVYRARRVQMFGGGHPS